MPFRVRSSLALSCLIVAASLWGVVATGTATPSPGDDLISGVDRLLPPPAFYLTLARFSSQVTAEPSTATASWIFPPDRRLELLTRASAELVAGYPVRLIMFRGLSPAGTCSGELIAEDLVLTAAHCLWDFDVGFLYDSVVVELEPTRFDPPRGYGYAGGSAIAVPRLFVELPYPLNNSYDLMVIKLDYYSWNRADVADPLRYVVASSRAIERGGAGGPSICAAGYPGDKPRGTLWLTCSIGFIEPFVVDFDARPWPSVMYHRMDASYGQSGSAIQASLPDTDEDAVIGVMSSQTLDGSWNTATMIHDEIVSIMQSYCRNRGCSFTPVVVDWGAASSPTPTPTPTRTPTPSPAPTPPAPPPSNRLVVPGLSKN